ncbi:MAG: oxaloacetate decarboxylase subunit alpha [Clostridia bacterium]|nr:oxaloacetate decarboxylase subunit alpha [Clostridia bacterium]
MANNIIQPKPVGITETVLRDAHQSLIATRMTTDEILPIVEKLDGIGYHSLEAWGGATFDSCLRFLNEDPWERLRKIKDKAKNTPLQMLFRGQNILGYRHYADDIVRYFVQASIANGIDVLRIFDALNDVRNLECAINATKEYCEKEGRGHVQATVCYTTSEFHTNESFVELAKQLEGMGADSICIKDMAGLLKPYVTYDLVSKMKEAVKIPIQLHTHYTSGEGSMVYLKAIEAGIDVVDCAMSPLAMGTSQPPTEPLVAALQGTPYDTGLDMDKLIEASNYFKPLREKYIESGLMNPKVMGVDVNTLKYQVPGGMLSNLVSQLKQQGREDAFDAVLEEVPRVRADLGYPPLVTPSSQIVGTQAVLNVLMGERYKMVSKETKALVRGEYGKCPGEIDPELVKKIIGDDERITCRPADKLEPEFVNMSRACADWIRQDEDILSYALFDQVAVKYFQHREAELDSIDNDWVDRDNQVYPV